MIYLVHHAEAVGPESIRSDRCRPPGGRMPMHWRRAPPHAV